MSEYDNAAVAAVRRLNASSGLPSLDEVTETFGFFDDWEDRYRYLIDLGKTLSALPDPWRNERTLVRGCQSQVWLVTAHDHGADRLLLAIDSDAHIVRGLAALVTIALSGKSPAEILAADMEALFSDLALMQHLSPSRGNGLRAMLQRIRDAARDAEAAPEP